MQVTREAYLAFLEQVESALEDALKSETLRVANGRRAELQSMHREVVATRKALVARLEEPEPRLTAMR